MFVMSSKVYEFLKKFVTIVLPAFSTLYIALAELWDLPASLQVAGTCSALAFFLGTCLGISSSTYNKLDKNYDGTITVEESVTGQTLYSLNLDGDPAKIKDLSSLRFKVDTPQGEQN